MEDITEYGTIQTIAKAVLSSLAATITASDTERTIAERAVDLLASHGLTETWYHRCPALVLLGSRSCLSISGRDYSPSNEMVGDMNLVTVDLSPCSGEVWGDCARSFCIEQEHSVVVPSNREFQSGMSVQSSLHKALLSFATPDTTFSELFAYGNELIVSAGFENLDFLGNLGHSIVQSRDERCYVEAGNHRCLGEVRFFTFEPHIRAKGGRWGFKHENIYFFRSNGRLEEL